MPGRKEKFLLLVVVMITTDNTDTFRILQIHKDGSKEDFMSVWRGNLSTRLDPTISRNDIPLAENLQYGNYIDTAKLKNWKNNTPMRIVIAACNKFGDILWKALFNATNSEFIIDSWMKSSRLITFTNDPNTTDVKHQKDVDVKHWYDMSNTGPTFGIVNKSDDSRGWFAVIGEQKVDDFSKMHFIFSKNSQSYSWKTDVTPLECLQSSTGFEYKGTASFTKEGYMCQRWDAQYPHSHWYDFLEGENNFCRNSRNNEEPWCYTTDPDVQWGHCPIWKCEMAPPKECVSSAGYFGNVNHSMSGQPCVSWVEISDFTYLINESNYCRIIPGKGLPVCYTSGNILEICNIPECGAPRFMGCISDIDIEDVLVVRWPLSIKTMVDNCLSNCASIGFKVAALKESPKVMTCVCIKQAEFKDHVGKCRHHCSYDRLKTCGGTNYFSVYSKDEENYFFNYGHGTSKILTSVERSYTSEDGRVKIDSELQNSFIYINGIRITMETSSNIRKIDATFTLQYNCDGHDKFYSETRSTSQPKVFTMEQYHSLEILKVSNLTLTFDNSRTVLEGHMLIERTVNITLYTNVYPFIIAPYVVVFSGNGDAEMKSSEVSSSTTEQTAIHSGKQKTDQTTFTVISSTPEQDVLHSSKQKTDQTTFEVISFMPEQDVLHSSKQKTDQTTFTVISSTSEQDVLHSSKHKTDPTTFTVISSTPNKDVLHSGKQKTDQTYPTVVRTTTAEHGEMHYSRPQTGQKAIHPAAENGVTHYSRLQADQTDSLSTEQQSSTGKSSEETSTQGDNVFAVTSNDYPQDSRTNLRSEGKQIQHECLCNCSLVKQATKWNKLAQKGLSMPELYKELEGEINRIKKTLAINKSSISIVKRKKMSAVDDRSSSLGIGCIGVMMIVAVVISLVVLDSKAIAKQICKQNNIQ